jgi:hypothetical protein
MNTTRNLSKVMAIALRSAVKSLRQTEDGTPIRYARASITNALDSIDVVAEELEQLAAAPVDSFDVESLVLHGAQLNHALEWLSDGPQGGKSDDAIVKITDAKGHAICTVNAAWLRALTEVPRSERQVAAPDPDGGSR